MASAAAIINARAHDNMLVFGEYALQDPLEPGDYRFVPPLEFVYRPAFGDAIPFGIGSGADFLPDPPPALTSRTYATPSTRRRRSAGSTARSVARTRPTLAAWWLEFNEIQWGRIMRQLTDTRGLGLLDAVRMFALANMANIDATLAVRYAKNFFDFWRPFHAIRLGRHRRQSAHRGRPALGERAHRAAAPGVPVGPRHPVPGHRSDGSIDLRHRPRQLRDPVDHRAAVKPGPLVQPAEYCLEGVQGVADHGRIPLPLLGERRRKHGQQVARKIVDTQLGLRDWRNMPRDSRCIRVCASSGPGELSVAPSSGRASVARARRTVLSAGKNRREAETIELVKYRGDTLERCGALRYPQRRTTSSTPLSIYHS